jgi:hypothetical protein
MASSHPDDYKCDECNMQFYYSGLYREHMFETHRKRIHVIEQKTRDEVDVPLDKMTFTPKIPDNLRVSI